VIAPEYALAPERPWPAALDDTVGCVRAVRQTEIDFDIDPARLILLGEEAGGMLAVLAARALHQAGDLPLLAQVLISPILAAPRTAAARYGGDDDTDPVASLAGDRARRARDLLSHLVRQAATGWQLCGGPGESGEQVQWPLEMAPDQLAGLPPTWLLTAGLDPWHGQALAWAARLHAAGITVTHECFEGMVHGFLGMGGALAAAGHGQSRIGQFLRPLLRTPLT
jgi:acetyl esterase